MQRADAGTMQRGPDTAARGLGVAIESWADRAARSRPAAPPAPPAMTAPPSPGRAARHDALPRPPAPEPVAIRAPAAAPPDPEDYLRPEAPPRPRIDAGPVARPEPFTDDVTIPRAPSAADEADWLATRLSAEIAQPRAPARNAFWKRRLAVWSIAGGLVAGVAAGGLWLYKETRGVGAPVVVAKTAPAGTAPAAAGSGAQASAAPEAATRVPQPAAAADIVRPLPDVATAAPVPVAPAPDAAADRTVKTVDTATAHAADVAPPKRAPRQAVTADKRPAPKTPRARTHDTPPPARVAAEPSARQRREELLMQCRAHGYDERRCFQRACTMTRYGLVCRG